MRTRGIESLRTGLDIDRLFVRFGQFGGWRVLREYARMGVLGKGAGFTQIMGSHGSESLGLWSG